MGNGEIVTDGDEMAAAIVNISTPAYVTAADSRGSSAFPSSRSSAWTCFPFRGEIWPVIQRWMTAELYRRNLQWLAER